PATGMFWQGCLTLVQIGIAVGLPHVLSRGGIGKYLYLTTVLNTILLLGSIGTRQAVERQYALFWFQERERAGSLIFWMFVLRALICTLAALAAMKLFWETRILALSPWAAVALGASILARAASDLFGSILVSVGRLNDAFAPQMVR